MKDQRRFRDILLKCKAEGFPDLSEEETQILKDSLISHKDIKEEEHVSIADVKRRIQKCYHEDHLDMRNIIQEQLDLKLIEPGNSPYSSPGFLVQKFPEDLKEKKQLQSFLGVVNFVGMFIKNLAEHRKIFSPLLKKDVPFIWKEGHREGMKKLKEICKNLPKLSIPQDEDELRE
ncbi:uncharacterized protein LOC131018469 [Salvia miltiorrhiza]|uniref:uncharacterized protein LOC131018469 n=1 Tax=Salvia miltiorrhiza TaxID=226208 RepID=UPI0025ABBE55|nr:uncharacterized protein LOC131018469 [Salvia miltiorrhiza]